MRRAQALAGAVALVSLTAVLAGCGGGSAATSSKSTPVTKLLVFMVENHSLTKMQQEMPFAASLATKYGYADGYHALSHPSLPN